MNILEKNLKAIAKKNKELSERLKREDIKAVEIERTKSGDFTFRYRGRYFHSIYDPWKEIAIQTEEILSKDSDWVLLFGMGCAYLLRALVREGKKKIIVYEPSLEILKGVLENIDISDILSEDHVYLFCDMNTFINTVRTSTEGLDDLLTYQPLPYRVTFPEEVKEFLNKIQNVHIINMTGLVTEISSRFSWLSNYFSNLPFFQKYPPVDTLRGRFRDIPLIIVGAGPSLKKNAHLLRDIKGKALIIAAATAYRPLVRYGVVPDFVISAEKTDLPAYFTYGEEDRRIRLLLGEISHPNMFKRDTKGKFVYFNGFVELSIKQAKFWGSDYLALAGGSVTTTALDMGIMLGCNPIVFIGQDLAFGEGTTHADGCVYVDQNIVLDTKKNEVHIRERHIADTKSYTVSFKLLWLKGVNGRPVPSKYDWVTFHKWFEDYMRELNKEKASVKVINATEGGAYIEGMEHTTLKEVIDNFIVSSKPVEEIIQEAESSRPPIDYDGLSGSFNDMEKDIKRIQRLATDILKEARSMKRTVERKGMSLELQKNLARIKRLEERLFDKTRYVSFIWEALSEYTFELKKYLRDTIDDEEERFKKDIDTMVHSYTAIRDVCGKLVPLIDEGKDTIRRLKPVEGREYRKVALTGH